MIRPTYPSGRPSRRTWWPKRLKLCTGGRRRDFAAASATADTPDHPKRAHHLSTSSTDTTRLDKIRQAKPFSDFLTDTFERQHDYLRISLTERCNLRCLYCMPQDGVQLSPTRDLLTTAEIHYLSRLFVKQGVQKIRLTGGEPTVRKDFMPLMQRLGDLRQHGLREIALTTNGISLHRKLEQMVDAGLTGVNISLDTLDPFQFELLTRRRGFDAVMKSIDKVRELCKSGRANLKLKINCVAMRDLNHHQILPFVEMTRNEDLEVRFIEYMPFDGNKWSKKRMMSYADILSLIRTRYPNIIRLVDAKTETSKTWQVPGFAGRVGFITSMTHNFCGSCSRLRITADGSLKVCLHGQAEVSLRNVLRQVSGGEPLVEDDLRIQELMQRRLPGLTPGENHRSHEQYLLEVIGTAVKRKEKGHAGMEMLKRTKNRPMILIGG